MDECYSVETQRKIYMTAISPITGEKQWPVSYYKLKAPAVLRKQPRRPSKKRKKEANEETIKKKSKLSKIVVVITCSICEGKGYNIRSCTREIPMVC